MYSDSTNRIVNFVPQRLLTLQEKCDERQALLLGTLVGWFMNQVKLRESK